MLGADNGRPAAIFRLSGSAASCLYTRVHPRYIACSYALLCAVSPFRRREKALVDTEGYAPGFRIGAALVRGVLRRASLGVGGACPCGSPRETVSVTLKGS